jgi:hypothetical protein
MTLLVHCPITNKAFRLNGFGQTDTKISSIHPLLNCPIAQLSLVTDYREEDAIILLSAWLEQLAKMNLAFWLGALNANEFPARWIDQELPKLRDLAEWLYQNKNHPAHQQLPQLRLNKELTSDNIQNWREICNDILQSYTTQFDAMEVIRLKQAQTRAMDKLESTDSPARRKSRSRQDYLARSFNTLERQQDAQHVIRVIQYPQQYNVESIQDAKKFCLEYCIETTNADYNDKQEILQLFDIAILDRIGLAAIMNGRLSDEHQNLEHEIQAKYSLSANGQLFTNGATPKIAAAIHRNTRDSMSQSVPSTPVPIYATEPIKSQYPNLMAYMVAHKQWSRQQS